MQKHAGKCARLGLWQGEQLRGPQLACLFDSVRRTHFLLRGLIVRGLMGMGDKLFAVPWAALALDTANKRFTLNVLNALAQVVGARQTRQRSQGVVRKDAQAERQ
jgi:hypothetical protein